jgi:hypothetical protein
LAWPTPGSSSACWYLLHPLHQIGLPSSLQWFS